MKNLPIISIVYVVYARVLASVTNFQVEFVFFVFSFVVVGVVVVVVAVAVAVAVFPL